MRPQVLFPLFKALDTLKGVGPRLKPALERLAGEHIVDMLWHLPTNVVDRRHQCKVAQAEHGQLCTMTVRVLQHIKPPTKSRPYRIICEDDTGTLVLTFFHAHGDYLTKTAPEGELRVVSGTVEHYSGEIQITHPDHVVKPDELEAVLRLEPVYALTHGVSQKVLSKAIKGALGETTSLPEWHDQALLAKHKWHPWHDSLLKAHAPEETIDLNTQSVEHERLAYDELLANQLALALVRRGMRKAKGHPTLGDGRLRQKVLDTLPFALTGSQDTALSEIIEDMETDLRMLRLLQGDVGSGKTVVAVLSMLAAIEAGGQAVLMAPTEIWRANI